MITETSLYKIAQEWVVQIEKTKKLNKQARHAVLSFAIWFDNVVRNEQAIEDREKEHEN